MISFIVAMSENRVIGVDGKLPWHIPEDLKRFKKITGGHPVIMGRKTFDSIGKPLPNRTNVIITRNKDWRAEGVVTTHSFHDAVEIANRQPGSEEIFIIGGGEIFKEALAEADKIYLTIVHQKIKGDAFFPEIDEKEFKVTLDEKHDGFTFKDLERKR
jgi:dihydrofolate reductase